MDKAKYIDLMALMRTVYTLGWTDGRDSTEGLHFRALVRTMGESWRKRAPSFSRELSEILEVVE